MGTFSTLLKRSVFLTLGVTLLASCQKEAPIEPPAPAEGNVILLELPGPTVVETRATTGTTDENRIADITVLVFDASSKVLLHKLPGRNPMVNGGTNGNQWKFNASVPAGTYDLMALANASGYLAAITPGSSTTKTTVARALFLETAALGPDHKWATTGGILNPIPMWGELPACTVTESSNLTFKMTRMLARINVTLAGGVNNFKLKSIRYYNYNTKGYVMPETGKYTTAGDGTVTASAPSVYNDLTGMGKQTGASLLYAGSAITGERSCNNQIYVYEAASTGSFPGPGTDWSSNTAWRGNPCLVLGGLYGSDTEESYYRVDFIQKGTFDVWLPLLRNFSYNVTVTGVTGRGYGYADPTTPSAMPVGYGAALSSAPMNMDVSTYVTNESNTSSVTMDGPYSLSVSENYKYLPASASTFTLLLKTSYDGWRAEYFNDAACTQPLTGGWLSVSPAVSGGPTPAAGLSLTVSATKNTGYTRKGYIRFTAGRMSLVVEVEQSVAAS